VLSLASLVATFAAGLASFFAPCTVPLLPAYLAYISGVSAADLADPARQRPYRGRLVGGTLLYVAGFATVFVLLGIGAGGLGRSVAGASRPVEVVGGVVMVVFGLVVAGLLRIPALARERRLELPARLTSAGPWLAFPLGAVFGIGWTPCVGPYLGSALALAAVSAHLTSGAILLLAYAAGLGLPFMVAAVAWASLPGLPRGAARLARPVAGVGGVALAALGVVLVSGEYGRVTSLLAQISTPR